MLAQTDLSSYIILDLRSGTYFAATDAILIDLNTLTTEQQEEFEEGSDIDRLLIAAEVGLPFTH